MQTLTSLRLVLLASVISLGLQRSGTLRAASAVSSDGAPAQIGGPAGTAAAPDHQQVYALPPDRITAWIPGVPGGIPHYTTIHAALQASAEDNDARAAIHNALNAAGTAAAQDGIGRVVALSAGTFHISGELYLPSRVVLRGAGPDSTRLVAIGNKHPLIVIGISLWPHPGEATTNVPLNGGMANETKQFAHPGGTSNLTATGLKGSTSVTVENPAGFAAGQLVFIDEVTDDVRSQWNLQKHPPGKWRNWYSRDNRPITQILEPFDGGLGMWDMGSPKFGMLFIAK